MSRDVSPPAAPVVALANRLPVVRARSGAWQPADGGLVAALRPALERRRSQWVGWDGGHASPPQRVEGIGTELVPVHLRRSQVEAFYHGFANRTLWPLFHGLSDRAVFERRWWRDYVDVNERFAATALAVAPDDALLWVHDYQLLLVPLELRRASTSHRIGFFLHIPFPAPDLYSRLPWRSQLLEGLLGADVLGFQTEEYRTNFLRVCPSLDGEARVRGSTIELRHRAVETVVHGVSIDASGLAERARLEPVWRSLARLRRQFHGRRVIVGVDRLDYTKGIVERLRAIELLLDQRPELRGRIAFVQVAVPSRGDVREYRELRSEVEQYVGRINGRFTTPGEDVPVHYLFRGVTPTRLLAYYRLADVCLVTPLRDGMNLVAKEFVVCQGATGGSGVLVLSEFAGASSELPEALPCNPFDVEGLAGTIELAFELDEDDRRSRIETMARRIERRDVNWWIEAQLRVLAHAGNRLPARV